MFWQTAYARTISLPQGAPIAARVDVLHDFLWWLSVVLLAMVTLALVLFVKNYHHSKKGRETAYILGSHALEITWTVLPLILMLFIFAWGYRDFKMMRAPAETSFEVNVTGRQWMWAFEYANGRKTLNQLYLPKGKAVRLIMTSDDVIHSFFIPNYRIKQDVVPGIYTALNFIPELEGVHPVYCAEFCGGDHSRMLANIYVMEQKDFDEWYNTGKSDAIAKLPSQDPETPYLSGVSKEQKTTHSNESTASADTPVTRGRALFNSKGCFACHSADGTKKVGPSMLGIFGREEELENGSKIKVDENYIRESILEPNAKTVKGYPPSMPTFKGLVSDEEISSLIAYLKSLKN